MNDKIIEIKCCLACIMSSYKKYKYSELQEGLYKESDLYRNYEDYVRLQELFLKICELQSIYIDFENNS